jgi:hypothetical protein
MMSMLAWVAEWSVAGRRKKVRAGARVLEAESLKPKMGFVEKRMEMNEM